MRFGQIRIHDVLTDLGILVPIICTPEGMVDDDAESEEE